MLIHNAEVTGSLKINNVPFNSGSFSGSFRGDGSQLTGVTGATTASYVEYSNVGNKPALVSGSSQITYSGISGIPAGIVSGSSQISYTGLSNIPVGIVSGSAQVAAFGFATTGSNQFNGSQAVTGSLTVTGQVVAQTLNVQQVTSSIVFSSGSNVFGNSLANTQQFTGSLQVSGSSHYMLGNVGLGTTNPGTILHLVQSGGPTLRMVRTSNRFDIAADNDFMEINARDASTYMIFKTVDTERMRITSAGNVLIGATDAGFKFQVEGEGRFYQPATNSTAYLRVENNRSRNAALRLSTSIGDYLVGVGIGADVNQFQIYDNVAGGTRLTISSTGAATFSSSVTTNAANSFKISSGPYNAVFHNESTSTSDYNAIRVTQGAVGSATGYIGTGGSAVGNTSFQNTFVIGTQTSNALVLNTNDAERMRITSGGNVLIGTTTDAGVKLDVLGTARISGNSTYAEFSLKDNTASGSTWFLLSGFPALGDLTIREAGVANHLVIKKTTGNVGIGIDNPNTKLNVVGGTSSYVSTASSAYGIIIQDPTSMTANVGGSLLFQGYKTGTSAIGNFGFITGRKENGTAGNEAGFLGLGTFDSAGGGYERMRITSAGRVGIGTTDPQSNLEVRANDSTAYDATSDNGQDSNGSTITVRNGNTTTESFAQIDMQVSGDEGRAVGRIVTIRKGSATSDMAFVTENANTKAEKMRITSGGNVSIGHIGDANQRLRVQGVDTGSSNYGLVVADSTTASTMYVRNDGAGYLKASAWSYGSDLRIKENISNVENGVEMVLKMKPKHFDYIDGQKDNLGFIAQDIQKIIPEAVSEINEEGLLGLKTDFLIPYLVKAIQEQQSQIESLKSENDTLKSILQRNNIS